MARVMSTSTDQIHKKSLCREFRELRVLGLPVGLMMMFSFLGHRSGQFLKGCSSIIFNSYVIFNCFIILVNSFSGLVKHNYNISYLFFIFFNIAAILIVFLLTYKFYKKNNLYSLFLDVKDTNTNMSWKQYIFPVSLLVAVVIPSSIYILYEWVLYFIMILTGDKKFQYEWFTFIITDGTLVKTLLLIDSWVTILTWRYFLCTSYALSVINLMLSAEYDEIANVTADSARRLYRLFESV